MNYSINCELSENIKKNITKWLNNTLLEYMEEECDEVFIEYILVMIINNKTMKEISIELEAFIGENACSELALRIGEQLRYLIQNEKEKKEDDEVQDYEEDDDGEQQQQQQQNEDQSNNDNNNNNNNNNNENNDQSTKGNQPSRIINLNRKDHSNNPKLSEGLKSSRGKEGSTRLVQTALKNTLNSGETQENKKLKNSRDEPKGQSREQKRQRIVQIQDGKGKGFVTTNYKNNNNTNNNNNNFNPETLDPQTLMNIQAQNSGFANIEEMMNAYFQKNMLAMMQNMNHPIPPYGVAPALPPIENFGHQGYMPGMIPQPHFPPTAEGIYQYSYPPSSYPNRGRGRSGRTFRGSVPRGRGFYPTSTGRGVAPTSSDTSNTVTATTSTVTQITPMSNNNSTVSETNITTQIEQNQANEEGNYNTTTTTNDNSNNNNNNSNGNDNVNTESTNVDNNSSILNAGRGGFRGRFRGRETFRGRGRFSGRIIRGRNKTWVRGPGTETPLVTER